MIVVEILAAVDHRRTGWLGERDTLVSSDLLARQFASEAAARLAISSARANLPLPEGVEFRPVPVGHHGQAQVATSVAGVDVEVLGRIAPGTVLVLRAPDTAISQDRIGRFRDELAQRIGHSEFGVVFTGSDDATAEILQAADLAAAGWVYVGSPGVCPQCGSDQVVVHQGEMLARQCGHCGHRWSQFHPGVAA